MMDGSPHRPFRTVRCSSWLILSVMVLVVLPGCPAKPTPPAPVATTTVPGKPPKLTREDSVKLLALRDRAIGHLENIEFDQAQPLLLEIIRQVPDDPFGLRNLVICRELIVDKLDPSRGADQRAAAIKSANEAVKTLFEVETKSYVPHVLAARMAMKENNTERAATELRRAIELAPKSAPVWYDLFLLNPLSPGEPPAKETIEALRKAHELEPDNLFVLKDWLLLQTQLKEPQLAETVTQARGTLDPFADVIKTNTRVNISDLLDRLSKAIGAMQWPTANSAAMTIRNVIVAESSRDERYVHKNSLEYVLFDYGPAFYDRADLPDAASESIPVTFAAGTLALGVPKGTSHFIAEDLDFDGQVDGVGLAGDQLVIVMPLAAKTPEDVAVITLGIGGGFSNLLAVDLDDDIDRKLNLDLKKNAIADLDLIAYGAAGIKLFENQTSEDGARKFVAKPAGDALAALRDIRCVVPADLDLDGDLDFLTMTAHGLQLWSNKGNWTFDDITSRSKLPPETLELTSAAAVDWDRDSDIDVLIATSAGLGLLENMHHGRFRWRALEGDFASINGVTSLLIEQLGRRPSWSVIASGPNGVQAVWTETTAAGVVSAKTAVAVDTVAATGLQSVDFDNDGIRDLLAVTDSVLKLWRGLPNGQFHSHAISDAANKDATAVAIGDIDQDGDEDLLWCAAGTTSWLANNGGNANGWLNVSLVAEQLKPNEQNYSKRVNNHGIGSMIEVRAGDRYQAQVVRRGLTHFGLGADKQAQVMRTLWTNGLPNNLIAPAANQRIYEEQILIGSCPYLYTWDGEKFAFCTDLLWNAPLGLKFAEDVVAPWREWEYLKIDGDRLKAKDGSYPLRVTAELWEVEYFDEIKLFAVDHPAGTQIFTNEKVGPESLATHKIHTVTSPHVPVAARDPQGRDILDQVKARDGVYTKTYERKFAQGLTNEHFLELDLGAWPHQAGTPSPSDSGGNTRPPIVTLFLTGWMYPGSTSLRVQHSQNPDLQPPRPPALHAVDSEGQWREFRPFMGFPGGKTKTIAVDISDVFAPGSTDHRLRIVTNMEFYWDAAFFTVNDEPVEFEQFELSLGSAKLVDRGGVSFHSWPEMGNGPDQFDYHKLVPGDAWPPIEGAFTRFGDILPLLNSRDDHLVVLHPGDEMQLEFTAPAKPVREGWVRDFVIYNVGWDKDCDHHTVYGETSEPLPFSAMTVYPFPEGEAHAVDDDYVRYLKMYQTRRRARGPFWNRVSNH